MRVRLHLFVLALIVPVLAACETAAPRTGFPELTFTHMQPVPLAVGSVEIVNEYRMPFSAPNVEHQMPVAPGPAAERWGRDVLRATGGADKLVMVIADASVRETELKVQSGLQGAFQKDQSERYDGRLAIRLEVRDGRYKVLAVAEAFATRSATIGEDASLVDRETLWYGLTEGLMRSFDSAIRPQIAAHMRAYRR